MVKKSGPQLWVRTSSFSHPHNSASQLIRKHLFNCKVQLLLPVQSEEASSSLNVPDISAFYYSVRARISLFADQAFISRNIADAGFQCLSYGHTYGLAVTPDSHLHLALPKDLYQTAGLQASQIADTGLCTSFSSMSAMANH